MRTTTEQKYVNAIYELPEKIFQVLETESNIQKLSKSQIKLFQLLFPLILRNNKNYRFRDYVLFNF